MVDHNVSIADWARFLEDIEVAGRLSGGQRILTDLVLPTTAHLGAAAFFVSRAIQRSMKRKKEPVVLGTIEEWAESFFAPRGLDVYVAQGQERLTSLAQAQGPVPKYTHDGLKYGKKERKEMRRERKRQKKEMRNAKRQHRRALKAKGVHDGGRALAIIVSPLGYQPHASHLPAMGAQGFVPNPQPAAQYHVHSQQYPQQPYPAGPSYPQQPYRPPSIPPSAPHYSNQPYPPPQSCPPQASMRSAPNVERKE
ncbi:Protein of unknown function DUF4646 [Ceraceosorus bombacis]|uniref:Uncharacterized protein n=1 Tax=Ceraceosorus bombacis TaxID=401625 RepID=A0A0N7LB49_9BASI|nr:Protein of unknown function DUF4646 [Ceraceosorus bombacis]